VTIFIQEFLEPHGVIPLTEHLH